MWLRCQVGHGIKTSFCDTFYLRLATKPPYSRPAINCQWLKIPRCPFVKLVRHKGCPRISRVTLVHEDAKGYGTLIDFRHGSGQGGAAPVAPISKLGDQCI